MGPGDKDKKKVYVLAESPTKDGKREQAFITEGNNVKTFYQRTDPDTEVEVIPFYGQEEFDAIKEKLKGSSESDRVMLFGHNGKKLGGVDHSEIAKTIKDSGIKNCDIGSCSFESNVNPYKDIQNVTYRPNTPWYGFNPKADNLISGMYSRSMDWENENSSGVEIVKPEEGKQYNRIFTRPVIEAINSPERPKIFQNQAPLASMIK